MHLLTLDPFKCKSPCALKGGFSVFYLLSRLHHHHTPPYPLPYAFTLHLAGLPTALCCCLQLKYVGAGASAFTFLSSLLGLDTLQS